MRGLPRDTVTTNEYVAIRWFRNQTARNHGGTMGTDGNDLYSYNLLIGFTTEQGTKILLDYTARAGHFRSMTTSSKHISQARYVAHQVMNPSILENTDILASRKR